MKKIYDGNFFEVTVDEANPGDTYEYRIYHDDNTYTDHCDPFGFQSELRTAHKSVICDLSKYSFHDSKWMKNRSDFKDKPLNIYEMHLGSWRKKENRQEYSYREPAKPLIQYLKKTGFNYVEFMPLCEYPCDTSWGYQNTGFFYATSRYGTPTDLMHLIDKLHQNHIGVILDFVPVHFAVDEYALAKYNGKALYEYPHNDVGVSEWGSYNFMNSRGEVRSFLQSNANFWLSVFHFDGLRHIRLTTPKHYYIRQYRTIDIKRDSKTKTPSQKAESIGRSIQITSHRHTESDRRRKSVSQIQIRQCEHNIQFGSLFSQTSVSCFPIPKNIFYN